MNIGARRVEIIFLLGKMEYYRAPFRFLFSAKNTEMMINSEEIIRQNGKKVVPLNLKSNSHFAKIFCKIKSFPRLVQEILAYVWLVF